MLCAAYLCIVESVLVLKCAAWLATSFTSCISADVSRRPVHTMVMKAVKPAVNKKSSAVIKEPVVKKPACSFPSARYYRTVATAGNYVRKGTPTMFMEVGATSGWLAGEVDFRFTVVGGPCRIKQRGEVMNIFQPINRKASKKTNGGYNCIGTQTGGHGQIPLNYGGFEKAVIFGSILPGTLFQAQTILAELDDDDKFELGIGPPNTVVTLNGDIILKITVSSFAQNGGKETFVHLMRQMQSSDVAILKREGLMWDWLGPGGLTLDEGIEEMRRALGDDG